MTDVFDESVGIDDEKPHVNWAPTLQQIAEFAAIVRSEWTDSQHVSRMRVDLRPQVSGADRICSDVSSADYFEHLANNERNSQR